MNEELLALHAKVNGVIYNPFVNLKDQAKAVKTILAATGQHTDEITRLDAAILALDELEALDAKNIERIKGFNKVKNQILKLIREITSPEDK
jgi:hypothetical protein